VCSVCMIFYTMIVYGVNGPGYIPFPLDPTRAVLLCHMSVLDKTVSLPIPAFQGHVTGNC
jgi:hypothetical protein